MPRRKPRAMTESEQRATLHATRTSPRNHALVALAIGTGLRQSELLALDCGDVYRPDGAVKCRLRLRHWKGKASGRGLKRQEAFVGEPLRRRLAKLRQHKSKAGESLADDAPLLVSRHGNRLSAQRARSLWQDVQRLAGLDRRFSFHELRHTAITNAYRKSGGDLRLAQSFARHASPETTAIYAHVADEALEALADLSLPE